MRPSTPQRRRSPDLTGWQPPLRAISSPSSPDPVWALDSVDRARLDGPEAPFGMPEAIIWADGSWMIRFAECGLAMGEEFGIGVRFDGSAPVAIEDLSRATEIETD